MATSYYWTRNGGGNPELEPWKSNNFDLSFEKYFGDNKGYFAAAIYYKDLDTYIFNQSVVEDFTGAPLPAPADPSDTSTYTIADANRLGVSTLKTNGKGGYVQGFELTLSLPFSLFADPLDGFGIILSGAKNESSLKINDDRNSDSRSVHQDLQLDHLLREVRLLGAREQSLPRRIRRRGAELRCHAALRNVSAESLLDAQIGYAIQEGALKGLSFSISGTNLTDEPFVLRNVGSDPYDFVMYENYGAVYAVAVNYSFQ